MTESCASVSIPCKCVNSKENPLRLKNPAASCEEKANDMIKSAERHYHTSGNEVT